MIKPNDFILEKINNGLTISKAELCTVYGWSRYIMRKNMDKIPGMEAQNWRRKQLYLSEMTLIFEFFGMPTGKK